MIPSRDDPLGVRAGRLDLDQEPRHRQIERFGSVVHEHEHLLKHRSEELDAGGKRVAVHDGGRRAEPATWACGEPLLVRARPALDAERHTDIVP